MWGSTGRGSVFPPGPAKLRPGRCSRMGGWWRRDLPAAPGGRCPGAGSAFPPAGPAWQRGSWLHTQGLWLASWLQDATSVSLLLPSFLYLSYSNMQAVTLHQGQQFSSLFHKYFYSPFFSPGAGCQIGSRMNAAGRERGAEEPGTEHVSRGVGLGRAV